MTMGRNNEVDNGEDVPPRPRCECNVYDSQGNVVAWRTWACPLHKYHGWLSQYGGTVTTP